MRFKTGLINVSQFKTSCWHVRGAPIILDRSDLPKLLGKLLPLHCLQKYSACQGRWLHRRLWSSKTIEVKVWWFSMVRSGQSCRLLGWTAPSFDGEVVPVKYSTWKEWKSVVISRSSYQPVGQRLIVFERVLQVGLESQKWGWQLDYEWFYT